MFVFGYNEAGIHGAGAVETAHQKHGARWDLPNIRLKKRQRHFVKLLVKGRAIEAVRIYADFRRIVLHCRGAWSKKGKMRCVGNKVIVRSVRKGVGERGSVVRQHAIAAELGSPKLNWRFHILQALRGREYNHGETAQRLNSTRS